VDARKAPACGESQKCGFRQSQKRYFGAVWELPEKKTQVGPVVLSVLQYLL
jgi:hypothetical protein